MVNEIKQSSTTSLKRVCHSTYALKNLGINYVQGKNYRKLKNTRAIRVHQKQRMKNLPFWILVLYRIYSFAKTLLTQNLSWAFNKGFCLRQVVNCLLRLFENSYNQKCVFVKDFQRQFNINFFILMFSIINFVAFQTK